MPSRRAAVAVVLFWLGITGYMGYTRVLPWLAASDVPAATVSASDEASRSKVRWTILFNKQKAGSLTSELRLDAADTYTFVAKYTDVRLSILVFTIRVPKATTEVTVDRSGHLRRQSMSGTGEFDWNGTKFTGSASVTSQVVAGELRGRAEGSIENLKLESTELPPVPVPAGQVLNPLMPMNRLAGVEPGQSWRLRLVDPLQDSLKELGFAVLKQRGVDLQLLAGRDADRELLAEVLTDPEVLPARRGDEAVPCRVIVYRGKDNKVVARTWVSAADGRVMRQEATVDGMTLRLDRDE